MGNELQKELEKMNNEIAKHENYLKSEKTTYGLADLINGKIPSKQLPSEVNLTANTLDDMNALIASGAVNDGQLCYLKEDKKLYVLKDGVWSEVGGGGKSVPPTLNLINFENGEIKTSVTEEEKNNLNNGLYNQVVYVPDTNNTWDAFGPSKLIKVADNTFYIFQFHITSNEYEIYNYSSISWYFMTIDEKNTSNEYPLTIEKHLDINPLTSGGGSANSYPYITGSINASDTQTSSFPKTDSETRVVTIENLDLSKLLSTRTIIVDADADASEVFNIACGAYGETEGIGQYVSSISCDKKTNNLFFFYINMDIQTNSFIIKRKTIPTSTNTITFED